MDQAVGASAPGALHPSRTPLVMGVLNVTPDSFSDGGRYLDPDAAVAHGAALFAAGADIVDVGGESTRPGAAPVDPDEEAARVVPVVAALAPLGRVSIDTRRAEVAAAAIAAGATLVNDVSASLHEVAADLGVGWVAMHMRGEPATMQHEPVYGDVVAEVRTFLAERLAAGRAAGITEIWLDPGLGFGKTAEHNLALLQALAELTTLDAPILIGASRKRTLAEILRRSDGSGALPAPDDRLEASVAVAVWAMAQGASMVRVHDVLATAQAARLLAGPPKVAEHHSE